MKNIPNIITFSRIIGSIILIFVPLFSTEFYILYTFCGLSDIIDGYVARKFNFSSNFGSIIDSIADLVFVLVCLLKMYNLFVNNIYLLTLFIMVCIIKIITFFIGIFVFKKIVFLHNFFNKIIGFCLFFMVYFSQLYFFDIIFAIVGIFALIASVYELIYILK